MVLQIDEIKAIKQIGSSGSHAELVDRLQEKSERVLHLERRIVELENENRFTSSEDAFEQDFREVEEMRVTTTKLLIEMARDMRTLLKGTSK